jgi:serine/threonine protein kinase
MAEMGQLAPGSKCDRYDIIRLIGAGGMGEVYQAMHEFTKKQVALKVLKITHAAKEHHVEKMRAEAMVLCQIKHPHLVEVYDAGFADVQTTRGGVQSLIWMAMELLEGESLRERLSREGAIRPALALEWAAQIADGIQAAHEASVIHRDLKPENIFITKKGDIRVLDFGTAKFDGFGHNPTRAADRVGTIPYMSPEHLNGEDLDGRSDIYALGFILYEMLAGRHPFSDENAGFPPLDRLLPMALAADPDSLAPHVGDAVWQLVERSVQKDRDARFGSMREAAAAYRQVAATYGTDTSGALRLSGSSANNPIPAAVADTTGGHRQSAIPAGGSFANMTPPPLAAGVREEKDDRGFTGGAIVGMALAAAAMGALAVVLVTGTGGDADAKPASADETAQAETDPAPSASESAPASEPTAEPAPSAEPSAAASAPSTEPSAAASAPSASVKKPPPSRTNKIVVPPPPPPPPPPKTCWSDEPVPRKIPCP